MSEVLVITDVHIGVRLASLQFAEHQLQVFETLIFPDIKKRKIKEIICCGDLFDNRQYTQHRVLDMWLDRFFDYLQREKVKLHLILGNHDLATKNSLTPNAPSLLLSKYENIIIYDHPQEADVGCNRFLFLPWICATNYDDTLDIIKKTKCTTVFAHLELSNFEMSRGQIAHEGMSKTIFDRFISVYSGHYHHKSDDGKIFYLGNTFEFNWADHGDIRGYHILNTSTLDMQFIQNNVSMFNTIRYNDADKPDDFWLRILSTELTGKYVKLLVESRKNLIQYDKFLIELNNLDLSDLKIVEDVSAILVGDVSTEVIVEDSISLIDSYVDDLDVSEDKAKIKDLIKFLYVESLSTLGD